ncbi:hypothetical protein [Streptomyces acidiscabies]|uniref:Uncharacterized protein n=1 Tax=Streptomyces acidiscabies TaxID=42234 RepID=A0A0L0K962_9ACTN|nr:hypothetical protein [Streptomyces acidiscabies]KND34348.1 hypothetical protein IQ63_16580 [Streptomyces acidiscabies]
MRIALRAAVTLLTLTGVGAATVTTAGATTKAESALCIGTATVPSAYGGLKVRLFNSADEGASATLVDKKGAVVARVDQSKPANLSVGIRINGVLSAKPVFQQRSQGGSTPWKSVAFPALTVSCTQKGKLVRTERLDAHQSAQIFKVAGQHYQARVFKDGKLVSFVDADVRSGAAVVGNRTLVLDSAGHTLTWTGVAGPNARQGRYRLANGDKVKLVRDKNKVYGAQLTTGHGTFPLAYAPARPVVLQDDNTIVVLTGNGLLSGYAYGRTQKTPVYLGA